MEEINLIELFKYYIKKLPIAIIIIILVLITGYLYTTKLTTPMYHGTTTIILVQKNEEQSTSTIMQSELTINEKLVSTYSKIIKSRSVLEQVIKSLKLNITDKELAKQITVTSIKETSIIEITVSDKDNRKAARIANKLAEVFKKEITEIYNLENVSVIDKAITEKEPYNINILKQMLIYSLLGIALSSTLIFILYYFDNSIKNKNEIETKINLPVLGEIPNCKQLINPKKKK